MHASLQLLLRRLASKHAVLRADEFIGAQRAALQQLQHWGFLRPIAPASSASCPGCHGAAELVERLTGAPTGRPRIYATCPDCGPTQIPAEQLRRWQVDVPKFLAAVGEAGGIKGPVAEVVPRELWRLGKVTWGQSREVLFATLAFEPSSELCSLLTDRPKSILFVPTERQLSEWHEAIQNETFTLEDVLRLDGDRLVFATDAVVDRLHDPADAPKRQGAVKKRASRAAKIERLTKEVEKLLLAARDYARHMHATTGTPALLPRPTQRKLAEMSEMDEVDVSRCFKDPHARLLRWYWDMLGDLDSLLGWSGPKEVRSDD